jgi:hypothetical protein
MDGGSSPKIAACNNKKVQKKTPFGTAPSEFY